MMEWLVLLLWLAYVPIALNMLYRIVKNHGKYMRKVDLKRCFCSPILSFVIASKRCPSVVQDSVDAVHSACKSVAYGEYQVYVVTDSETATVENACLIRVPEAYQVDAKYKARALNYALETLPYDRETWNLHLDEESIVTEQAVRAVLEHIEDNGAPIAEGAINYPVDVRNMLTFFLEAERAVSCHYCVDQMETGSPVWLHGSNLLVRSDVEKAVGWEFGDCLAEDQRFAFEAEKQFGKEAFAWHGGLILEKPAFTLKDALKQRKRWFTGSIQNLRFMPMKERALSYFMLCSWGAGFFSAALSPLFWFGLMSVPVVVSWLLGFSLVFWLFQYQYGIHLNLRHMRLTWFQRLKYHFAMLVLSPLVGFLSTVPTVLSVFRKPKTFEIVEKS